MIGLIRSLSPRWLALGALLWALLGALPSPLSATSLQSMTMAELVDEAALIFEGQVSQVQVQESGGLVYTWVSFQVEDVIKGQWAGEALQLRFLGGDDGQTQVAVAELVLPSVGERGIYFVEDTQPGLINPLLGWSRGHYLVRPDASGRDMVYTNESQPLASIASQKQQALAEKLQALPGNDGIAARLLNLQGEMGSTYLSPADFKAEIRDLLEAMGQ